jgi:hypothetical protein
MYKLVQPSNEIDKFWLEKYKKDLDKLNSSRLNGESSNCGTWIE